MNLRCLSCIAHVRIREVCRWSSVERSEDRVNELLTRLRDIMKSSNSVTTLAVESFKAICEILGVEDPYYGDKKRANQVIANLLPDILRSVGGLEKRDLLKTLMALALIGNAMDPCVYEYVYSAEKVMNEMTSFKRLVESIDDSYLELILEADKIAYVVDNAGEFILDLTLAQELIRLGIGVELIVKGEPYETDVTLNDIADMDLKVPVFSTFSRYPAFHACRLKNEVLERLTSSDLIISKGIANYESLSETKKILKLPPVMILMKAKCNVIARNFNVALGDYVIRIV